MFVDPIPYLQVGTSGITTKGFDLATLGRVVEAVAADSATRVVLRIPAHRLNERFRVTILNDSDQQDVPRRRLARYRVWQGRRNSAN